MLANLNHLILDRNRLNGNIPPELGGLANLERLWINDNQLTGSVPTEFGTLSNLSTLRIENNNLSGVLPSELGYLRLREVSIWGNQFTGADHYENGLLSDMVALVALYEAVGEEWSYREGNYFYTGKGNWLSYQPFEDWVNVTTSGEGGRVVEIDLNQHRVNNMSGNLPPELGLLTALEKLNIEGQGLTGEIPPEIGKLENLRVLRLNGNQINGQIPSELGNLANLKELSLQQNQLSGPVPPELGSLSNLEALYLDSNQLSGELPSQLGNLSGLRYASIWDNKFTWADYYENGLLSDMVALVALYEAVGKEWTYREGNYFYTGKGNWLSYQPFEDWVNVTTSGEGGRVVEIDLNQHRVNNMSGNLPPELGLLTALEKLNIEGQGNLTGCIPASLRGIEYKGDLPFCTGAT